MMIIEGRAITPFGIVNLDKEVVNSKEDFINSFINGVVIRRENKVIALSYNGKEFGVIVDETVDNNEEIEIKIRERLRTETVFELYEEFDV